MKKRDYIISGIQQIGIGVTSLTEAWDWYIRWLGMDCRIFEDEAVAKLMLSYTGGEPQARHAVLAINLQGGGGFEVWQHKSRVPQRRNREILVGDLGIFAAKIKVREAAKAWRHWNDGGLTLSGPPQADPAGGSTFFLNDPYGNLFHIVEADEWFMNLKGVSGGTYGAMIGVTDVDRSRRLYSEILGYDRVIYDVTGTFDDLAGLPGGDKRFRRLLLAPGEPFHGGFNPVFGQSVIELVQALDRQPSKIYEGRYWGDPGFIHLCYDIRGMDQLRSYCSEAGFPFTVDSMKSHEGGSFDMGEAAGYFAYIEDPDGTLIEFVETHKVPILKKLGWYLDLRKRNPHKPLPSWMIRALRFSRVKATRQ